MGHRLSKSTATSVNGTYTTSTAVREQLSSANKSSGSCTAVSSNRIPIPPVVGPTTINLQIQESPTALSAQLHSSSSGSLTSVNTNCPTQVIITIQLAKMENGNEPETVTQSSNMLQSLDGSGMENGSVDRNSNQVVDANAQIVNVTLNSSLVTGELLDTIEARGGEPRTTTTMAAIAAAAAAAAVTSTSPAGAIATATGDEPLAASTSAAALARDASRTAGSPTTSMSAIFNHNNNINNNNNSATTTTTTTTTEIYPFHSVLSRMSTMQLLDELERNNSPADSVEYCEVLEESATGASEALLAEIDNYPCTEDSDSKSCCRRKSKSSPTSQGNSKRRCCKCTCRDAFRRILEPSSKSNKNNKEHKDNKHSNKSDRDAVSLPEYPPHQQHTHAVRSSMSASPSVNATINSSPISITTTPTPTNNAPAISTANQVAIWTPNSIIPFNTPQLLVVQCPLVQSPLVQSTSLVALGRFDENGIRLVTTEIVGGTADSRAAVTTTVSAVTSQALNTSVKSATPSGPIVHSQVDFRHCLVPDLDKITNSTFYWGKMDRYEAERLLEGKPEGTFLLRDSAQEEFLFSVTFRKYGRSLHARIEQSGHNFSFDCHDPCVYTAPTVTGLLEHYKDPACVMFFEPMLTIPLHRKTTFSLQQLCRATIVSSTTYDGINELELPSRLKAYLKEYHYKQKLRVKLRDGHSYACS